MTPICRDRHRCFRGRLRHRKEAVYQVVRGLIRAMRQPAQPVKEQIPSEEAHVRGAGAAHIGADQGHAPAA